MVRSRSAALLFTLLVAPGFLSAQADSTATSQELPEFVDTVRLTYNWPIGLTGDVTGYQSKRVYADGAWDSTRVDFGWEMVVQQHERGQIIRYRNPEMPGLDLDSPLTNQLEDWVTSLTPDIVVSKDGVLVDIEGLEETVAQGRKLLDAILAPLITTPEDRAVVENVKDLFLSEEQVYYATADDWGTRVEFWLDAELAVGQLYETDSEQALPIAPDIIVPFLIEFGVSDRVKCREDDPKPTCVELIFRSFPDPDVISVAMGEFLSGLLGSSAEDALAAIDDFSLEIYNEVSIVMEPETLLTHTYSYAKSVYVEVEADGQTEINAQEQFRHLNFQYR